MIQESFDLSLGTLQAASMDPLMALPTEIIDSYPTYPMWLEGLVSEVVGGDPERKTVVIVKGPSASGKYATLTQIAVDVPCHPRIKAFEIANGVEVAQYHLGFGNLLKVGRDIGLVKSPQGKISQQEYAQNSGLILEIGTLALSYLPGPAVFYFELNVDTATLDGKRKMFGIDRDYLLARHLVSQHRAFCADVSADWEVSKIALEQRVKMEQVLNSGQVDQVKGVTSHDGVSYDVPAEQVKNSFKFVGGWTTRRQQELAINRIAYKLSRAGELSGINKWAFLSLADFNQRYQGQEWVNFYRDHLRETLALRLHQGDLSRVAFFENRLRDKVGKVEDRVYNPVHVYPGKVIEGISALAKRSQKPEFVSLRERLKQLKVAS